MHIQKQLEKTVNVFRKVGLARMLRKGYTIVGMVPAWAICRGGDHECIYKKEVI